MWVSHSVPAERRSALTEALRRLDERGPRGPLPARPQQWARPVQLVGQDRPGIVRQISRVIAAHGVNMHEIETMTGRCAHVGRNGEQGLIRVTLIDPQLDFIGSTQEGPDGNDIITSNPLTRTELDFDEIYSYQIEAYVDPLSGN